MLSENTNKLTWVGITVGVVVVLAIGGLALFPTATSSVSDVIHITTARFLETEQPIMNSGTQTLVKKTDYEPSWHFLEYRFVDQDRRLIANPKTWTVVDFDFTVNNHENITNSAVLDINTFYDGASSNDSDDVAKRRITWTDKSGHILGESTKVSDIQNNKAYHVEYAYYNNNSVPIYQSANWNGTALGFFPDDGISDSTNIDVHVFNFKAYSH